MHEIPNRLGIALWEWCAVARELAQVLVELQKLLFQLLFPLLQVEGLSKARVQLKSAVCTSVASARMESNASICMWSSVAGLEQHLVEFQLPRNIKSSLQRNRCIPRASEALSQSPSHVLPQRQRHNVRIVMRLAEVKRMVLLSPKRCLVTLLVP